VGRAAVAVQAVFEGLAIDVLSQCDVSRATRILRISWDEAWGLMRPVELNKLGHGGPNVLVI
jgi:hypothetical protein